MAISDRAQIEMELGTPTSFSKAELTNPSGDNQTFQFANSPLSQQGAFPTVVMPQGVKSGLTCTTTGVNDEVKTSAGVVVNPSGASADADTGEITVAADTSITLTRALATDVCINSIVVDGTGAVSAVKGTDGSAFNTARNSAGGPPYIPVGSVEVAQVKLSGSTAGPVLDSEISQTPGVSQEGYKDILWTIDIATGTVTFSAALPLIHTAGVAKEIYGRNSVPIFSTLGRVTDYSPAETNYSSSSTAIYDGTVVGQSSSLSQSTFTAYLDDGLTDPLLAARGDSRWIRFKQNKDLAPYELTNGTVGVTRSFPPDGEVEASVQLLAADASIAYES